MGLLIWGVPGTTKRDAPGKPRLKEAQNSWACTATPLLALKLLRSGSLEQRTLHKKKTPVSLLEDPRKTW